MSLGVTEILLILGIALLFFGPSRLPGLGKSMGEAIRGFKKGIEGLDEEKKDERAEQIRGGTNTQSATQKNKDRVES